MGLNQSPETLRMVREISDHLDEILDGKYWYCHHCMTEFRKESDEVKDIDDDDEPHICPECGNEELCTMYIGDYFDDILDVDFTVTEKLDYRGCRICIAWGGPGIWIDTMTSKIELHWGSDNAEVFLNKDTVESIDEHFENEWLMILDGHGVRL